MNLENAIKGTTYSISDYKQFELSGDKNIFEEVIDRMMMDGFHPEVKDVILNMSTLQKRLVILSLLEKDRNLFLKIKDIIESNIFDKKEHITEIVKMLREYVKVSPTERRKFGEVMTPTNLITDILNKLPKEVWSNPNLKWLDACNGVGPFMCLVIYGLMKGLEKWQPNSELRYKHIIENMIYSGEIQPSNVFLYLCAVDPKDEYKTNVFCGDFLSQSFDDHMKTVWKIDKLDVILGNPPYDSPQEAKGKRGGGVTLWDKFVIKYTNILKDNGYLALVHPTLWRKPQSERSSSREVNQLMMNKQIHYLEMHDTSDGLKTFNAGTRYDFYVMENCPIYKNTIINGEDRKDVEVDLRNYDFIPNYNLELFDKIVAKNGDKKCPIIFNVSNYETRKNWVSDKKDENFKYTLIHSTPKSGTRYMYSLRNDNGHFGIPKIIFGESGIGDVIIDMRGDFGMTQGSMAIHVSSLEEADNIKKALLSNKFSEFLKTVLWSNFRIDWRLFTYIKKDFWKEFI